MPYGFPNVSEPWGWENSESQGGEGLYGTGVRECGCFGLITKKEDESVYQRVFEVGFSTKCLMTDGSDFLCEGLRSTDLNRLKWLWEHQQVCVFSLGSAPAIRRRTKLPASRQVSTHIAGLWYSERLSERGFTAHAFHWRDTDVLTKWCRLFILSYVWSLTIHPSSWSFHCESPAAATGAWVKAKIRCIEYSKIFTVNMFCL